MAFYGSEVARLPARLSRSLLARFADVLLGPSHSQRSPALLLCAVGAQRLHPDVHACVARAKAFRHRWHAQPALRPALEEARERYLADRPRRARGPVSLLLQTLESVGLEVLPDWRVEGYGLHPFSLVDGPVQEFFAAVEGRLSAWPSPRP